MSRRFFRQLNYFHLSMKNPESAATDRADVSSCKNRSGGSTEVDPRWSAGVHHRIYGSDGRCRHFDWKNTKPFEDLRRLQLQLILHYTGMGPAEC